MLLRNEATASQGHEASERASSYIISLGINERFVNSKEYAFVKLRLWNSDYIQEGDVGSQIGWNGDRRRGVAQEWSNPAPSSG